uniref:CCC domain-containing protein n=1 Tax=Anopheles quadriannulatus TaxID=34691 RepID=A0A904A5J9_ANOQN
MMLAISRLLPVLVFVCGACLSQVARAALATNEVHLPEEQSTHRHHAHHAGQKESPEVHGGKVTYASPSPVAVYHIEHNQSESGARQYLAGMEEAELRVPAWCKQCNETVMEYCRSGRFLNDHCCCENSYAIEQLPWIPHTCYREQNPKCEVNAGSCPKYRAIKVCCCDPATKQEYKNKYSSAIKPVGAGTGQLLTLVCVLRFVAQFVPSLVDRS